MADIQFSNGMGAYGREPASNIEEAPVGNSLMLMTNLAGAAVSLALIVGIGVWGYKLMVRDVSGIPVVRAAEGEMRVRPEDPGGLQTRHQGLAVNAVAAEGAAAGPVDQVVLAPREVELTDEDQPIVPEKVAAITQPEPLAPAQDILNSDQTTPVSVENSVAQNLQSGAIDAVVAELTQGLAPLEAAADDTPVVQPAVVRFVKRPKLRPAGGATLQTAAFVPSTTDVDAAAIPPGTRLAQLGAFESEAVARSEWDRLLGRFGDYMTNKSRVVQRAVSGGRTFYRLRAMGFVDLADARRFCSTFKAEGVDCIPVASK